MTETPQRTAALRPIVRIEYKGLEFRRDYINRHECFICNAATSRSAEANEEIRSRFAPAGAQFSEHARAAGFSDMLRKPLVRRDIAESVARVLRITSLGN